MTACGIHTAAPRVLLRPCAFTTLRRSSITPASAATVTFFRPPVPRPPGAAAMTLEVPDALAPRRRNSSRDARPPGRAPSVSVHGSDDPGPLVGGVRRPPRLGAARVRGGTLGVAAAPGRSDRRPAPEAGV